MRPSPRSINLALLANPSGASPLTHHVVARPARGNWIIAKTPQRAYLHLMEKLEEQIAHLTRTVEDLSDIVARQETEISVLTRRVEMLMRREGEREAAGSGGVVVGDERPPHY